MQDIFFAILGIEPRPLYIAGATLVNIIKSLFLSITIIVLSVQRQI